MPRIALIHAMHASIAPAHAAFAAWPEARPFDLLDSSLAPDFEAAGTLEPRMVERFLALARYAHGTGAAGILFTCSAFGPAIEACQRALPIPVLKPNEAGLIAALEAGPRIGLLATFAGALPPIRAELQALSAARRLDIAVESATAAGALAALNAGRPAEHDRLIAAAAATLPELDALVLCQFSMARAAAAVATTGRRVITTPAAAVAALRAQMVGPAGFEPATTPL